MTNMDINQLEVMVVRCSEMLIRREGSSNVQDAFSKLEYCDWEFMNRKMNSAFAII